MNCCFAGLVNALKHTQITCCHANTYHINRDGGTWWGSISYEAPFSLLSTADIDYILSGRSSLRVRKTYTEKVGVGWGRSATKEERNLVLYCATVYIYISRSIYIHKHTHSTVS